jgi:hypothetical protein
VRRAHGNHDFLEIDLDAGSVGLSREERRNGGREDFHRSPDFMPQM